jgi:hypothetical protein
MNFAGNAEVSQESDVFRAMSKRFNNTPQSSPPPVRAKVFGSGKQSPKPTASPAPSTPTDFGSIGIYVLSGLILGGTFMLSRGGGSPQPTTRAPLPSSISIGGMNLDI